MARCPYTQLEDIESTLEEIRALPKVKEVKPGIFYIKSQGFLHFHLSKENERWADIHNGKEWGEPVMLPFKPSKKTLSDFMKTLKARHEKF